MGFGWQLLDAKGHLVAPSRSRRLVGLGTAGSCLAIAKANVQAMSESRVALGNDAGAVLTSAEGLESTRLAAGVRRPTSPPATPSVRSGDARSSMEALAVRATDKVAGRTGLARTGDTEVLSAAARWFHLVQRPYIKPRVAKRQTLTGCQGQKRGGAYEHRRWRNSSRFSDATHCSSCIRHAVRYLSFSNRTLVDTLTTGGGRVPGLAG